MKIKVAFITILLNIILFPQVENLTTQSEVYPFFKHLQVKGILSDYNDVILPKSREEIINAINEIKLKLNQLNGEEKAILARIEIKLNPDSSISLTSFPDLIFSNNDDIHLYSYKDSSLSFFVNPIIEVSALSDLKDRKTGLLNFGGNIHGTYQKWLGFSATATNGIQRGDRELARSVQQVKQSYTFNKSKMQYYDYTEGYLRVKKDDFYFQAGRERILWGAGYIDKTILSDNPPIFDFIKIDFHYGIVSYNFVHGWLVRVPNLIYADSLLNYVKIKPSKYIATSRLGVKISSRVSVGVSQMIIYADRPIEASYLVPMLFWESAQRSLNDNDNSYLSFDGRYLISKGLEVNSSIIFDDINFDFFSNDNWNSAGNRLAWQAGLFLTDPLFFKNFDFKLEYMQIRPYTFSHTGIDANALSYTSNGYLLGTDLEPNSTMLSAELDYYLSGNIKLALTYKKKLHGGNVYDLNGNLIKNNGGSYLHPASLYDDTKASLLGGNLEKTDILSVAAFYEFYTGMYANIYLQMNKTDNAAVEKIINLTYRLRWE